jgi:hypothetical protein
MSPARSLRLLRASVLALALVFMLPPASAAPDPAEFRLTPELLRKFEAVDAEGKRLFKAEEEDDDEDAGDEDDDEEDDAKDQTVEGMAAKLAADPKIKALLARHGLTPMEFALSAHALLHAGMYLAFEQAMDKQKAAELLRGYTKTQQANIELVRKSGMMK